MLPQCYHSQVFAQIQNVLGMIALQLVATTGQSWFLGLYSRHLRDDLDLDSRTVSNVIGIIFLCSAITVHLVGVLYDHFGPLKLVLGSATLMVSGIWIVAASQHEQFVYYGFFLLRFSGPDCIGFVSRLLMVTRLEQNDGVAVTVCCIAQMLILSMASYFIHIYGLQTFSMLWTIAILNLVTPGILCAEDIMKIPPHSSIPTPDSPTAINTYKLVLFAILIFGFDLCSSGLNLHVTEIFTHPGFDKHNIYSVYLCLAAGVLIGGFGAAMVIRSRGGSAHSRMVVWWAMLTLAFSHFFAGPKLLLSYTGSVMFAVMHGICLGMHVVTSETIVAVHFPPQKSGFVQGVFYSAGITGTGLAPIFSRALHDEKLGWERWMNVSGVILLCLSLLALFQAGVETLCLDRKQHLIQTNSRIEDPTSVNSGVEQTEHDAKITSILERYIPSA